MSDKRINLHDPIYEICARLGLEPTRCTRLDIRPGKTTVEILKTNANGKPYVDPATEEAATETLSFKTIS
jgi:hypothetical protein